MYQMEIPLLIVITAILIGGGPIEAGKKPDECGERPADIVFIMDSSGSILAPDFRKQRAFVRGVVEKFDISPNATRIGVLSYSNWAYPQFHLNTYTNKKYVKRAIKKIRHVKGDTNTADAIAMMRDNMFSLQHGARPEATHIAIVLTDGKSNSPLDTDKQAALARQVGIHMFAIGIGSKVDKKELKAIAGEPRETYMFTVPSFGALNKIKKILAIKTCAVTDSPTRVVFPTAPTASATVCGDSTTADVVFAASPGASPENTQKALNFFRDVTEGLDIADDKIRVGLVPKECDPDEDLTMKTYQDKNEVLGKIRKLERSQRGQDTVLRYLRRVSFKPQNGARGSSKKVAVMVVDGKIEKLTRAIQEANKGRRSHNIEYVVVGVGKNADVSQLRALATPPVSKHVFHVDNYDMLKNMTSEIRNAICPEDSL